MLDKSIDGALLALRKQIIRGKLDGLEHVEALLVMRGVDMPEVRPKGWKVALRGHVRAMVCEALREGPKTRADLVRNIAEKRPQIPPYVAYKRTDRVLWRMSKSGLVKRDGRVWSIR